MSELNAGRVVNGDSAGCPNPEILIVIEKERVHTVTGQRTVRGSESCPGRVIKPHHSGVRPKPPNLLKVRHYGIDRTGGKFVRACVGGISCPDRCLQVEGLRSFLHAEPERIMTIEGN